MTREALATPPTKARLEGNDLSEAMSHNFEIELNRLIQARGMPKSKREFQQITTRFVKRYMDTARATVREVGGRLIAEEAQRYHDDTAPQRAEHEAAYVRAKAEYDLAVKLADDAFFESIRTRRDTRDAVVRGIHDDMAKRMADADRIQRNVIASFKRQVAERFAEGRAEKGEEHRT